MHPILIIDKTSSDHNFITSVKEKLKPWFDEVDVFILNNGIPCDSDTRILMRILITDEKRAFVILDEKIARLYPEIIKMQNAIVMFKKETIKSHEVTEQTYSESVAILHSGMIDYIDTEFKEIENDTFFDVLGIQSYVVTPNTYEHAKSVIQQISKEYPCLFLSKRIHHNCVNINELKQKFINRNKWIIVSTKDRFGVSFDVNEADMETFIDSAIHSFADERLRNNRSQIYFKQI